MRFLSSGRLHAAFELGELRVVSLRDGYIDMPPTRLRDEDGCALAELPAAVPLAGDNLRLSVNAFHVTDGTRSLLVDTGASDAWHDPTMGLIYDALDEAGVDRAHITDVAITHRHEDHVSGLIAPGGAEAFPKLERVWIGAGDVSVFTGRLAPVRDRVMPVAEEVAINDWATAIPAPGHTPGHTVYEVASGDGRLLIWGDTVHVPTLQFERPDVTWELDGDQPQARAARAALLERLTLPHHFVAGAHLDSPGIARVTPSGHGYTLEYLAPPIG
ncbi:MBL fold metallo-hydrolase [Phytomonospora endophytica]|uniref:Glyoxylase-like metal-dependent hydrolase (Beta-lactamase superfamily II) n=1 Tax=Phytomonospora endophytica TaxID=714109 RepID=A0A841FML1_9ACTN|nr:MBL fold metallo-hydrolase [Phytomonospora endophytica]MBB6037366.1 glyoxylase-like metal-dependent hydrolase (beta-lactamase superfamily II) [Phytomonospora endophytica]GIG69892.1 MBL fold metallo-hydrolase [Phytomonospora endophytica]